MNFKDYLTENTISNSDITRMNKDLEKSVILKGHTIRLKDNNIKIIDDIRNCTYEDVIQRIKDYIDKKFPEEYTLKDKLEFLTYTNTRNNEIDRFLSINARTYQHKPLVCLVKNGSDHGYIIGYHHEDLQTASSNIIDHKEGYTIKILDGKFIGTKVTTEKGLTSYVIDWDYDIRTSNGCTELFGNDHITRIKHIRRKI